MTSVAERVPTVERGPAERRRPRPRGWPYLAPLLFGLVVWVYGPLLFTGVLSVLDWDLVANDPGFAGAANYARLVTEPEFPAAVARTGLYVAGMLPFATVVPMFLAITLWKRPGRAGEIYRALLVLPIMLAPVATAVAWQFILNPLQGAGNAVLGGLGLPQPNWLGDPGTALPVIVLVTAAKVVSLNTLLFGAALAGLDRRGVEAARIDGATEWEVTRFVLVPQLRPTVALLGGLCVVLAGQWVFTNVAVLTQGGPDGATDNVYYRLYTYGFTFFDIGTASAGAVVVVAALALVFAGCAAIGRRRDAAV
jgi:sn-glycerol 3-phosphate transport system permease protein